MEITAVSKFDVGQIVRVRGTENHFIINNVIIEVCPGGNQILYKGVVTYPQTWAGIGHSRTIDPRTAVTGFNESILEKIPVKEEKHLKS